MTHFMYLEAYVSEKEKIVSSDIPRNYSIDIDWIFLVQEVLSQDDECVYCVIYLDNNLPEAPNYIRVKATAKEIMNELNKIANEGEEWKYDD